jgi:predicted porin
MKKSLIALAVMGLSGVAMAQSQSSVTLYGVMDLGLGKQKVQSLGGNIAGADRTQSNDSSNKLGMMSGSLVNNGNSRMGLRGTEDLGGGMQAGFNIETGFDMDNGNTIGDTMWNRQANVWLSGGWGTLKMGRQFTPSYLAAMQYDLTGNANYGLQGLNYDYAAIGARANSAFAYVSPSFGGLTGAIAYVTKTDLGLPPPLDKAAWDAVLLYGNGPISAGFSVNKVSKSKVNYQLGGAFSFSNFKVAASYTQASNVAKQVKRGFGIGASATFGNMAVTVDLMRDTKNEWIATRKKYTNGLVELKYSLSKRTFLYGVYLRQAGFYASAPGFGSTNNYNIGLRHNF